MKITEIASLLGKGYKVDEIKELATMSAETPEVLEMAKSGAKISDIKELITLADPDNKDDQGHGKGQETDESDQTPDYKALYEDLKKKADDLQQTVSKIQEDNARKDNSGNKEEKSPEDILGDIMAECLN